MAQVMWYWQWPNESTFNSYDYSIMPQYLSNVTGTPAANQVAQLIKDCGVANTWHLCDGTLSLVNNVRDGLIDDFSYESVKKHIKTDWDGAAWKDLLRSEIDLGRPIIYRGDKSDLSFKKHIFVLDGYDATDPNFFHFNFGWGYYNNTSYNTGYHYLNDITPGSSEYNTNHMAIVGISPTIPEFPVNITDVAYQSVTDLQAEDAKQDISLPASSKSLVIENNGELQLTAGNSLKLQAGFKVNIGGKFVGLINPGHTEDLGVTVSAWINSFTPNGDGVNDELKIYVDNADSWEFEAFNSSGQPIFQSAGLITSNSASIWNGSGATSTDGYPCVVRFKNSNGRYIENAYTVTVIL